MSLAPPDTMQGSQASTSTASAQSRSSTDVRNNSALSARDSTTTTASSSTTKQATTPASSPAANGSKAQQGNDSISTDTAPTQAERSSDMPSDKDEDAHMQIPASQSSEAAEASNQSNFFHQLGRAATEAADQYSRLLAENNEMKERIVDLEYRLEASTRFPENMEARLSALESDMANDVRGDVAARLQTLEQLAGSGDGRAYIESSLSAFRADIKKFDDRLLVQETEVPKLRQFNDLKDKVKKLEEPTQEKLKAHDKLLDELEEERLRDMRHVTDVFSKISTMVEKLEKRVDTLGSRGGGNSEHPSRDPDAQLVTVLSALQSEVEYLKTVLPSAGADGGGPATSTSSPIAAASSLRVAGTASAKEQDSRATGEAKQPVEGAQGSSEKDLIDRLGGTQQAARKGSFQKAQFLPPIPRDAIQSANDRAKARQQSDSGSQQPQHEGQSSGSEAAAPLSVRLDPPVVSRPSADRSASPKAHDNATGASSSTSGQSQQQGKKQQQISQQSQVPQKPPPQAQKPPPKAQKQQPSKPPPPKPQGQHQQGWQGSHPRQPASDYAHSNGYSQHNYQQYQEQHQQLYGRDYQHQQHDRPDSRKRKASDEHELRDRARG